MPRKKIPLQPKGKGYWLARAEITKQLAAAMSSEHAKARMLDKAAEYEQRAASSITA